MPFKIERTKVDFGNDLPTYTGTSDEAKEHLENLRRQLNNGAGRIKSGVLKLVKVNDGYELRRIQWYHFGSRSDAKMKEAAAFVEALINTAYPKLKEESTAQPVDLDAKLDDVAKDTTTEDTTTEERTRKAFIPTIQKRISEINERISEIRTNFSSYLIDRKQKAGTKNLSVVLDELSLKAKLNKQSAQLLETQKIEVLSCFNTEVQVRIFLKNCGLTIGDKLGKGGYGEVWSATLEGAESGLEYVFKLEKEESMPEFFLNELTERGDLAASQVKELRHMTQPIFVVLKVTTYESTERTEKSEYHYVPAGKAEKFKTDLLSGYPGARCSVVGQLMACAPGKALSKVLKESPNSLKADTKGFKNVATTLCNFFKSAWEHNYCHFDIKPENMNLHITSGECTLFDGGLAKKEKAMTASYRGTREFMHPFLYNVCSLNRSVRFKWASELQHGSEVDAYSIAMTLLKIAAPDEFKKFDLEVRPRRHLMHPVFGVDNPSTYLDKYLKFLGPESKTAKALEANPKLKKLLRQCFVVSGYHIAGNERDAAFRDWETAFNAYALDTTPLPSVGAAPEALS